MEDAGIRPVWRGFFPGLTQSDRLPIPPTIAAVSGADRSSGRAGGRRGCVLATRIVYRVFDNSARPRAVEKNEHDSGAEVWSEGRPV